jgi:hypothetical protein
MNSNCIKNLSLMDNLWFSTWYRNMLHIGRIKIYSNSSGLLITFFIDTLYHYLLFQIILVTI